MTDQMFETIEMLRHWRLPEILAVLGALLVLVDYFFPTDWPAHLGYVLFSASIFFVAYMYGLIPLWSLLVAVAAWVLLELMHRLFFSAVLENAPGTPGYEDSSHEAGAP